MRLKRSSFCFDTAAHARLESLLLRKSSEAAAETKSVLHMVFLGNESWTKASRGAVKRRLDKQSCSSLGGP